MDEHLRLAERVGAEQEDVLATLQLVRGDPALENRLYEQLVDLLVEGMFLELRTRYLEGDIDRPAYVEELNGLAERCRAVGLLPLHTRD